MCRVTNEKSPAQDTLRKRSPSLRSLSSTSRSSSSSSFQRRVSFDDAIKVYPLERLQNEQLSDVFYRAADYRRFRLDTCLDMLDQQEASKPTAGTLFLTFCQRFISSITPKRKMISRHTQKQQQVDYPWLQPYHPHEEEEERKKEEERRIESEKDASSKSVTGDANIDDSNSAAPRMTRTDDTSLERRVIEELAFLI